MKQFIIAISFLLCCSIPSLINAQVITTTPVFPIDGDSVVIIFDAALGNAGLNNVAPANLRPHRGDYQPQHFRVRLEICGSRMGGLTSQKR